MQRRILIVEDEPELAKMIKYLMEKENISADIEYNGEAALTHIQNHKPDMIILDIMLPKINGFDVYKKMRAFTSIPVLILSAKMHDEYIIHGLEMGADDYMTKPFNNKELVLRVKKILNRLDDYKSSQEKLLIGDLIIDFPSKEVFLKNDRVELTPIEYKILTYMAINQGVTLSWKILLKQVWGYEEWQGGDKLVKVNIGRLRKKLGHKKSDQNYIVTVRGMGYRLVCDS